MARSAIVFRNVMAGVAFRAVSIPYYHKGMSPAGARQHAGRFNRLGVSAVYLGLDSETAVREYYGSEPETPLVLLPVRYSVRDVIDITGDLTGWPRDWRRWDCDWRAALSAKTPDCSSWRCGDDAIRRRASAVLYPSHYHAGGRALAVFTEDAVIGTVVLDVHDPGRTIRAANPLVG